MKKSIVLKSAASPSAYSIGVAAVEIVGVTFARVIVPEAVAQAVVQLGGAGPTPL